MKPPDFDRIRYVTQHFQDLQGLQLRVPLGLIFLSSGLVSLFDSFLLLLVEVVVILGAWLLIRRSRSYYRTTFGEVQRPASTRFQFLARLVLVALGLGIMVFLIASGHFSALRMQYLLFGLAHLGLWTERGGRWADAYDLLLAMLLLCLAAPATSSALPALGHRGMAQILCGFASLLAGLLDHRQLILTLSPLTAAELEASPATS